MNKKTEVLAKIECVASTKQNLIDREHDARSILQKIFKGPSFVIYTTHADIVGKFAKGEKLLVTIERVTESGVLNNEN